MTRRILLLLVVSGATLLLLAAPAAAHNTLVSSDPTDGDVLEVAPTLLTLVFDKPVPLDTLSIEMIDSSGVRSDLTGSTHVPNRDSEVLTPLPVLPAGEVTLRWRLVGPDGHPITGRIAFTSFAPAGTGATVPSGNLDPSGSAAQPSVVTATSGAVAARATTPDSIDGFVDPWSTPSGIRWLLRFWSYLAIMTIGGVIATTAFVWRQAWSHPLIRRAVIWALLSTLVAALAQLLVIASDISATPPWAAWSAMAAALETDAGLAFVIRIVLVSALAWAMLVVRIRTDQSRWAWSGVLFLGLLATWAYAGHSRSMRWSMLGVPLDVAHHAAAAAWLCGLAIVGTIAVRHCNTEELIDSVNRFARLAATSVAVIAGTGILQSIRLVGNPSRLLSANHGKYLLLKLVFLGAMLKVADINRQRVKRRFCSTSAITPLAVENLRRAMGTELGVGLVVVAVTAAMVVSPPAVAQVSSRSDRMAAASLIAADASLEAPLPAAPSTRAVTSGPSIAEVGAPDDGVGQAGSCVMSGSSIRINASGLDVECLQGVLRAEGFLDGEVVGTFDDSTDAAVKAFQSSRGLVVDGIVGQATAQTLGIWSTS